MVVIVIIFIPRQVLETKTSNLFFLFVRSSKRTQAKISRSRRAFPSQPAWLPNNLMGSSWTHSRRLHDRWICLQICAKRCEGCFHVHLFGIRSSSWCNVCEDDSPGSSAVAASPWYASEHLQSWFVRRSLSMAALWDCRAIFFGSAWISMGKWPWCLQFSGGATRGGLWCQGRGEAKST